MPNPNSQSNTGVRIPDRYLFYCLKLGGSPTGVFGSLVLDHRKVYWAHQNLDGYLGLVLVYTDVLVHGKEREQTAMGEWQMYLGRACFAMYAFKNTRTC